VDQPAAYVAVKGRAKEIRPDDGDELDEYFHAFYASVEKIQLKVRPVEWAEKLTWREKRAWVDRDAAGWAEEVEHWDNMLAQMERDSRRDARRDEKEAAAEAAKAKFAAEPSLFLRCLNVLFEDRDRWARNGGRAIVAALGAIHVLPEHPPSDDDEYLYC
jgi:hypothetical protein